MGLIHSTTQQLAKIGVFYPFYHYTERSGEKEMNFYLKAGFLFSINSLIDILLHPLHFAQSRFVLQNRNPNNSLYQGLKHFIASHRSNWRETYNGSLNHIPINLLLSLTQVLMMENRPYESILINIMFSTVLVYPFLTVMRKMECSSNRMGMLSTEYTSIQKSFEIIYRENGVRGFYRGILGFGMINVMTSILGIMIARMNPVYMTFTGDAQHN